MAEGIIKLSDRRHPLYSANSRDWAFYLQSFKGGSNYVNGNLFTHRLENPEDFGNRKGRAHFLNYCKPLPNIYTDYLYREPVKRPQAFQPEVLKNIDGRGKDVAEFMRLASTLSSVYGQIHVLVDKPAISNPSGSMATAALPYATFYAPENVLDWSVDALGNLLWVLLYEPAYSDLDPMTARAEIKRYRLVKRDGWEVWRSDEKGELSIESQGVWNFTRLPFATCYHQDIDQDMIGESMLVDIAPINRIIFNWTSCIDEQVERQTFSQLVMPDAGGAGQASPQKIGTATIFSFPAESKFPPSYISPDTSQIKIVWEMVEKHVSEIYRLALLDKGNDAVLSAASGVSRSYDFIDTNQALASKAAMMQRFENDVLRAVNLWFGKDEIPEGGVSYPKEFDVIALERDIKNALDLVSENISETFSRVLYKKLVRKAAKSLTEDELKVIDAEIDAKETIAKTDLNIDNTDGEPVDGLDQAMMNGGGDGEGSGQDESMMAGAK